MKRDVVAIADLLGYFVHVIGEIIGINDLIALRPGTGISPMEIDKVIGMRLKKNMKKNNILNWENLE